MKYAFLLLLLCSCKIGKSNRIDSLQNEADIQKFIISVDSNIRKNLNNYPIRVLTKQELMHADSVAGATHITDPKTWTKADLNDDGQTDLVVYTRLYGLLVVMDTGNGNYKVIRLKSFPTLPMVEVSSAGGHTILLAEHSDCGKDDAIEKKAGPKDPDKLIYKYGGFVEMEDSPANYDITSVTIYTGLCTMGACPQYKLVVKPNGEARYVTGTQMPNQGVFTAQLSPTKTKQVMDMMNYIRVKNMQDRYQPGCVFDGGGWGLVVNFKDGSEKKIVDFNSGGTFGLEAVYPLLSNIANTQNWKQIK